MKPNLTGRAPWLIFGLALSVALVVILVGFRLQSMVDHRPDPYWFAAMGRSVARGEGLGAYGTLLHRRAPLYPLFIGAVFRVFGEHEILVQLLQALAFAATAFLAYDAGRRVFNMRTGVIAGLIAALHPALLRYVADFHLETLFTFLFTASIWCSIRLYQRPDLRRAAAFGVTGALAALTKTVAVLYPAVFVACWLLFGRSAPVRLPVRNAVLTLAVLFGCMGLTIAPWTARNYLVTGHLVPISTGFSDAFLRGYVFSKTEYITLRQPPYTDGENESNAMFRKMCADEGAVFEQDDYQTDKILNRAAVKRLKASPAEFVRKTFVGLFTFWYEMTSLKNSLAAGGMAVVLWAFAIVGIIRARTEKLPAWLCLAPVLYFNLLLAPLLALGRYSVPVLPALGVLAAFGLDLIWQRLALSPKASAASQAS